MVDRQNILTDSIDADAPRYEPWLGVSAASFIPLLFTFVLPRSLLLPLLVTGGALLLVGVALLIRHRRR